MKSGLLSDREKAELCGPVETVVDDWSTTVFDREGRILEWRGNTFHGQTTRTYFYDQNGRLTGITGSSGDQVDEFRYDEEERMWQIRRVPAQPERRSAATGAGILFEVTSEGHSLTDGGTVETSYNELGEPVERRIVDDEGTLLSRILYTYDPSGRLSEERLVTENFSFPKAALKQLLEQIPSDQRAAVFAQLKTEMKSASQDLFGTAERSYVYNAQGRLTERHMRMGPFREDLLWAFSPRGEMIELTKRTKTSLPHEPGVQEELEWKCRYSYEYDEHGNWITKTENWQVAGNTTTSTRVRHLTYYS
jgi:hypothetical protein